MTQLTRLGSGSHIVAWLGPITALAQYNEEAARCHQWKHQLDLTAWDSIHLVQDNLSCMW
jgi:hypothetical protein